MPKEPVTSTSVVDKHHNDQGKAVEKTERGHFCVNRDLELNQTTINNAIEFLKSDRQKYNTKHYNNCN